jgi:hypothetical protein
MDIILLQDETEPDIRLAWYEFGVLKNLSTDTISVEFINPETDEVLFTKTNGIIGGDGTDPSNLVIAMTKTELTQLAHEENWWLIKPKAAKSGDLDQASFFTKDDKGTLMTLHVVPS